MKAVLAVAMVVGGGVLLYEQVTHSTTIYGLTLFGGGACLVVVGLALLREDFISPLVKGK